MGLFTEFRITEEERRMCKCKKSLMILATCIGVFATLISVSFISAAVQVDTSALREAVTVEGVLVHQQAFQDIADANGGTRASGTSGYDASADYVADQMLAAGYDVFIQPFEFTFFEELEPAALEQVSPNPTVYPYFDAAGFATMEYSGSGDVTAIAEGVDHILAPTGLDLLVKDTLRFSFYTSRLTMWGRFFCAENRSA